VVFMFSPIPYRGHCDGAGAGHPLPFRVVTARSGVSCQGPLHLMLHLLKATKCAMLCV
jgi:hypothetical protein